jgi:signal transduction histidine kinase
MPPAAHRVPLRIGALVRRSSRVGRRPTTAEYLLAAAAIGLVTVGFVDDPGAASSVYLAGVVLPVGLGLRRKAQGRDELLATLLLLSGVAWSLTSLANTSDSFLYSTGRIAVWAVEPVLVYLMLAYPSGELTSRWQRRVAAGTALTAACLYVPTALFAPFPDPSPWTGCGTSCPDNAFMVVDAPLVADILRVVREPLTVLLFAAAGVLVARRAWRATPILRSALVPVAVVAVFRAIALPVWFELRAARDQSALADALGWAFVCSLPALAVAFGVSIVSQRVFAGRALENLAQSLTPHAGVDELRRSLAQALEDPSLRIVYWVGGRDGRWVDESGWPAGEPEPGDGQAVTEVASEGRRVAAIVHDAGLAQDPALVRAAAQYALTTLENERLTRRLQTSIDEVRDSRLRIVAAADDERRRIERDLHDGAQQHLVALRIKLALMAERLSSQSAAEAVRMHDLENEVDAAIEEVRSFARGIYPPLLAERGLAEALRGAARGSPIATTVEIPHLRRYPLQLEATVYFACLEGLQNAAKHARDASRITISVYENGELRFEVHDNGSGFDTANAPVGNGLTNVRDRLAAVGGRLEIESGPRVGTTFRGHVPTR